MSDPTSDFTFQDISDDTAIGDPTAGSERQWPQVGVVLATHNRPELMRLALESILGQEYPGDIEIALVFDDSEIDWSLERDEPGRRVVVMANGRTRGLAGARNTGVLALETEFL